MIAEHGPPAEITIEMTRDFKLAPKKLAELESEQAANQNKNEKRADQIRKLGQGRERPQPAQAAPVGGAEPSRSTGPPLPL